jgi:MFS family permease
MPRIVHPSVWMVLFFPFGATSGFVSVTIGYLAKQQGIGDAAIAGLVAMSVLPHTFKFFWAPLPDTTFTRRRWYFASNVLSSLTLIGLALVPIRSDTLQLLRVLIFVNSLAVTFLGMAVEGLLAHTVSDTQRGTASGWLQAGNLGGAGLGGGLALFLAQRLGAQTAFIIVAVGLMACSLTLRFVPEPARISRPNGTRCSRAIRTMSAGCCPSGTRRGRLVWSSSASRSAAPGSWPPAAGCPAPWTRPAFIRNSETGS